LDEIPAGFGPSVVVIGNFDGVHRGHVHVLRTAAAEANGRHVVAITFDPHPMAVLRPEHAPSMLTGVEDRAGLLAAAGADAVFALPFSREVAAWTPDEFIDRVLVSGLGAAVVVVGANFRFGARASGDVESLRSHGGFEVIAVPLEGGPQVWSSTYIRQCLAAGDVEGAAEALGRDYAVSGLVVKGDQRGRELGYPTANVPVGEAAVPADGVYAGWLTRADTGERFPAAISVGTNPTFAGQRERRVEAYALDRDDLELYGVRVEIAFHARIRGMVAFDGVEALIDTMRGDVERTRELLA
jgi:riboflavin kinase/FMN adenylyltransferase